MGVETGRKKMEGDRGRKTQALSLTGAGTAGGMGWGCTCLVVTENIWVPGTWQLGAVLSVRKSG